jgi:hypothetical protein
VKKMPVIAMMLLVMGLILLPACDEEKNNDKLTLAMLYPMKYYLEFDVDYDNDGTPDEHRRMKVKQPFIYMIAAESSYWYQALYSDGEIDISIHIPSETDGPVPINYTDDTDNFNFIYQIGYDWYDSIETSHKIDSFQFTIQKWGGHGGVIAAAFNGYLYDLYNNKIHITNGTLNAKIYKFENIY